MFETSEEKLISQAQRGNKRAWLKLVQRYESSLYNYGVRMTGNNEDALDLMQEIFISVFRNLSSFRGHGSFRGWIFKIAHYRCIEFYRKKRPLSSLEDSEELISDAPSVDLLLLEHQQNIEVVRAMQNLPVPQRAVVELKFFGQFTFEEIAQQLDVSTNTVKSRLYSALGKLKHQLEPKYV